MDTDRMRTIAERIGEADHAYAKRAEHALDDAADEIARLREALREIQNETVERVVFARCVAALERPRWWHEATGV